MPRSKTAACSICTNPMWTGTGSADPGAMICQPCRRVRRAASDEAHRLAQRFQSCTECGQVFERPAGSARSVCGDCRTDQCQVCGVDYERKPSASKSRITCSYRCAGVLRRGISRKPKSNDPPMRTRPLKVYFPICAYCGQHYTARYPHQLHRRETCRLKHQRAATRRFLARWAVTTGRGTASGIRQPRLSYAERLMSRYVVLDNGCWQWIGTFNSAGYGQIGRHDGNQTAHRAVWEHLRGKPVPPGLELDHECHNRDETCGGGSSCVHRGCVNPQHLRAVTPAVNRPRRS